jgi:hypothetical protein
MVSRVEGHQLQGRCECGFVWRFYVDDVDPDEVMPECPVCGATVTDVRDFGPIHAAGADVEPGD